MGLYQGGRDPRLVDPAAIAVAMRPALEQWFTAEVRIEDPRTLLTTPYDAKTDTGGDSTPLVLVPSEERNALLQATREYNVNDFGDQALTSTSVRIQIAVPAGVQLRAGLQAVIVDGGNDAQLTGERVAIDAVVTSSIAWHSILQGRVIAS